MSNVLVLKSSISGNNAQTNQLADYVIEKLQGNHIVVRDLAQQPLPYFDATAATAVRGEPKNNEEKQHLKMRCTGYYSLNKFLKYLKQFCQNNNIQYNQEKLDAMLIQQYKIDRNLDDNNPNISAIGKARKKEKLDKLNQYPEQVIQEYVEDRFSFRYPQESDNEKYSLLLQVTLLYRLIIDWLGLSGKYRYNENNIQYSVAIIE